MRKVEIAVVGAGASGLMAAQCAGSFLEHGAVVLLEGNQRAGKKLLATGNGRCNLSNSHLEQAAYHGDVAEAMEILAAYPPGVIVESFARMGLLCREDNEGRLYPGNFQAAAVLQALRDACEEAAVETVCEFSVQSLTPQNGGFLLRSTGGDSLWARRCILASGGKASPKHGGGEGYTLAKALGHQVVLCRPALAPLPCKDKLLKALKGIRCRAAVTLLFQGSPLYRELGEVQFAEGYLSGICIFNASSRVEKAGEYQVKLDLYEELSPKELTSYLLQVQKSHKRRPCKDLLAGLLPLRLGQELVKRAGLDGQRALGSLDFADIEKVVVLVKELLLPVAPPVSFDSAQVTAGGIPLKEFTVDTLESKKQRGLYVAGELFNVHGDCGGYNLHFAWATGLRAGTCAAQAVLEERKRNHA